MHNSLALQAFVVIVVCLVLSVIAIVYVCLLPFKYAESYFWTVYHLIFGHWLLANVAFHYFKAAFTDPGHPPSVSVHCFVTTGMKVHI